MAVQAASRRFASTPHNAQDKNTQALKFKVASVTDVRYMFPMSHTLPGNAAPTPPLRPPFPAGKPALDAAARARRRVGRWLRYLGEIGAVLTTSLRDVARRRFEADDGDAGDSAAGGIDLGLGRALIHRALRWIAALQDRFTAEAKAAMDPPERLSSPPDRQIDALAAELRAMEGPKPVRYPPPRRDDCIDGKLTAEVVAQICADLDAAAAMLAEDEARRRIAVIAAAARAMLGEPEAALLPPPVFPGGVPGEKPAVLAVSAVVPPVGAPDTG
jgi:hypothetical protein